MWWLILKRLVSIHINNILCTWCVLLIAAHTLRYWFPHMYNYMYMCMYPLWLKALSHLILFECEVNAHCQNLKPNDNWIAVGVPHPQQPGQVTISTLVLLSQHSRCIETHKGLFNCFPYLVAGSRWRGTWMSMRSLGKRSLFWQHLQYSQ